jgi:hypothetical protein
MLVKKLTDLRAAGFPTADKISAALVTCFAGHHAVKASFWGLRGGVRLGRYYAFIPAQ